jgi:hypothetical protein
VLRKSQTRLLKVSCSLICLIVVSAILVNANFSVDAARLSLPAMKQTPAGGGLVWRGQNILSPEALDAQGYQTNLPDGYISALENEYAVLYFHEKTCAVAFVDKRTGQVWLSNPVDLSKETYLAGDAKEALNAQVIFKYYDDTGQPVTWDTYCYAARDGNISSRIEDGRLIVDYTLGKVLVTADDVPVQMSEERFLRFISVLDEAEQKKMATQYYMKRTIEGVSEKIAKELIKAYPNIVNTDIYAIRDPNNTALLTRAKANWDACGYTYEDLLYDNAENSVESKPTPALKYEFSVVYALEENSLTATLDLGEAKMTGPAPSEVSLLPYFGCGSTDEDGYLFVPDGSGALIAFNNGKTMVAPFSMKVYGYDTALNPDILPSTDAKLSFPVWGIKKGKAALLAAIEDGDGIARVDASVAGQKNSWNTVHAVFESVLTEMVGKTMPTHWVVHDSSPHSLGIRPCRPATGFLRIFPLQSHRYRLVC